MRALPVPAAAAALGVHPATLRRWLRRGAPQARRGRRGRGGHALVDPDAIRAWQRQGDVQAALLVLGTELPEVLADAIYEAHAAVEGSDKARQAGILAGTWFIVATRVNDRLRRDCPAVPEVRHLPGKVSTLCAISARSGKVRP